METGHIPDILSGGEGSRPDIGWHPPYLSFHHHHCHPHVHREEPQHGDASLQSDGSHLSNSFPSLFFFPHSNDFVCFPGFILLPHPHSPACSFTPASTAASFAGVSLSPSPQLLSRWLRVHPLLPGSPRTELGAFRDTSHHPSLASMLHAKPAKLVTQWRRAAARCQTKGLPGTRLPSPSLPCAQVPPGFTHPGG